TLASSLLEAGFVIRSSWPQGGLSALHAEPASSADPPEAAVGILPIELRTGSTSLRLEVGLSEDLLEPLASPRQAPPDRRSPVVDLTAAVEGIDLTARELRQLAPGDIVATEAKPDDEVILRVAGIPKYAGRLGSLNGHRAVTITRTLDSSDPPRS
ncbi:MAG: FliM/FliN family flagellar motor C-terminal domain-containing protein, partial [Planctomycetota bacterium]